MFRYVPFFNDDPFFDSFFGYNQPERQRRPRRTINYDGDSGDRQVSRNFQQVPQTLSRWYDDFGQLKDLADVLKLKEESDKYLVKVRDANASTKDLQVNYHKKENQLEVTISHNQESSDGNHSYTSSSTSTSRVSFDKPVAFEQISAEVGSEGVVITVPKMERDEENVFKIDVSNAPKKIESEKAPESK